MTYDPSASHDTPNSPDVPKKTRRGPESPTESWAARAIVVVAGLDPDGATRRNGLGFGANDSDIGRSLATAIATYGPRMTDRQWPIVVRLATRYRGQVEGDPMPPTEPVDGSSTVAETPDVSRVRTEIRRAEQVLDGILAAPERAGGQRCQNSVANYGGPGFGTCGACRLREGGDLAARRNRVCAGILYVATRRAWLFSAAGDHERSREIREEMGLIVEVTK